MEDFENSKAKEEYLSDETIGFKIALSFIIILVIFMLLYGTFYKISAGERGVLLTFGKPDLQAKGEGLHTKIPLIQKIVKMDVKTQKYEADATAASQDLQDVTTKIATNYHLVPESVPRLYQEIGIDYQTRVIMPVEQESVKAITARYTAEELITKRESVRDDIRNLFKEKLEPRGIIIEEVSVINFAFSPSFTEAIENKVTQEQNALAERNRLSAVEFQAQQRVAQAEGEAKAIKIQVDAIRQQGGESYVQLQAINKWDGKMPIVTGNSLPFINIDSSRNMTK
jgi:regulator of protease activity HflC (stomatin/prohibitin superfamily)